MRIRRACAIFVLSMIFNWDTRFIFLTVGNILEAVWVNGG